jgi:hypothetical protein
MCTHTKKKEKLKAKRFYVHFKMRNTLPRGEKAASSCTGGKRTSVAEQLAARLTAQLAAQLAAQRFVS